MDTCTWTVGGNQTTQTGHYISYAVGYQITITPKSQNPKKSTRHIYFTTQHVPSVLYDYNEWGVLQEAGRE